MKRLSSILLAALLLAGCGKKPAAPATSAPVPAAEASKPAAALTLDYGADLPYMPLGDMYEDEVRHGSFKIVNNSADDQTILAVEGTCPCLRLSQPFTQSVIPPGAALEVAFDMHGPELEFKRFARYFIVRSLSQAPMRAQFAGERKQVATVTPEREVTLSMQKVPTTDWEVVFHLKAAEGLAKPPVLAAPEEGPHLAYAFTDNGDGNWTLKVTPKAPLPYSRKFKQEIHIPVLEPASAKCLTLEIDVQVGEAVVFTPDKWTISAAALAEQKTLTARFAYGVVPGLQEEERLDSKDMMKPRTLRQKNAVPLKFVREHHDWDDLFAHLEFRAPAGVQVEKIRHPAGIELRVTVTQESFKQNKTLEVVPFRAINDCEPITISLVE